MNKNSESTVGALSPVTTEELATMKEWAAKIANTMVLDAGYSQATPEERPKYLNSLHREGFPAELLREQHKSALFEVCVGQEVTKLYKLELVNLLISQANTKQEYQNGMLVKFMRGLTWGSFEKFMKECSNKGVYNLDKLPFWFKHFNKPFTRTIIDKSIQITLNAEYQTAKAFSAYSFMVMTAIQFTKVENVAEHQSNSRNEVKGSNPV